MSATPTQVQCPSTGILIVGGGVMGLSVAYQLLLNGYTNVTIVSESFSPDTTSDGAGASLRPGGDKPTPDADRVAKWGKATTDFLAGLRREYGASGCGLTLCSGYEFWTEKKEFPFWSSMVYGMREVLADEMKAIGYEAAYAWFYTTFVVDVTVYLAFLTNKITKLGCKFVQAKITSLNQLRAATYQYNQALDSPDSATAFAKLESTFSLSPAVRAVLSQNKHALVINCSGIASRTLVPDHLVTSGKGCIVKVRCPGLTHFYTNLPLVSYIIPRTNDVVLGGSVAFGDYSTNVPDEVRDSIIADAARIIPEVKNAEILKCWAGHRPVRPTVRLELVTGAEPPSTFPTFFPMPQMPGIAKERFMNLYTQEQTDGLKDVEAKRLSERTPEELMCDSEATPKVPIIHNYGHGGSGITLHVGCAMEVLELVKSVIPIKSSS